jgi:hypothetical protein
MFIKWISQLLSLVGLPEAELVMPTLMRLAKSYPQALMFPFNLSKETIEESETKTPLAMKYLEQLSVPLRSPLIEAVNPHVCPSVVCLLSTTAIDV